MRGPLRKEGRQDFIPFTEKKNRDKAYVANGN